MSQPEKLPKVDLFLGSYSVIIAENSSNMSKNNLLNLLRIKVVFNIPMSKLRMLPVLQERQLKVHVQLIKICFQLICKIG